MKRILVIGSSGQLGSHLVKALHNKAEVVEASFRRAQHKVDIADPVRRLRNELNRGIPRPVAPEPSINIRQIESLLPGDWRSSGSSANVSRTGVCASNS